jgi:uncharacterized protein (TIGR02145 family)
MKKQDILIYPFIMMGIILVFASSCNKENEEQKNVPVLSTSEVTDISSTTVTAGGSITDDGGLTVTARGVCWSTSQNPTIDDNKTTDGSGAGSFISKVTGLEKGTAYYLRAYATNNNGTGYGSTMTFTTLEGLADIDGNVYQTVVIGNQEWMAENLKTTKLNDGTLIPKVTDNIAWGGSLNSGAYSYSMNDETNGETYGALYNWYIVNTGKLCPAGWHVPTDAEWSTLITYLGGESVAGGKLKEIGTVHWDAPNTMADNASGFSALPGGYRNNVGGFENIGKIGAWWSTTEGTNEGRAYGRDVAYNDAFVAKPNYYKQNGVSVRCVKD